MEAHQAPPALVFSRQEYWSGLLFQSVNERKECLKTQNGTRPLTHKMHFGIILAPDESSRVITTIDLNLVEGKITIQIVSFT